MSYSSVPINLVTISGYKVIYYYFFLNGVEGMFLIIKKKKKKPPLWKLSFQLPNLLGEYLLTEEKKNSRCLLVSGGFSNKPLLFAD